MDIKIHYCMFLEKEERNKMTERNIIVLAIYVCLYELNGFR